MTIKILPTDSKIGADVFGADLSVMPTGPTLEELEDALEAYGVLIFKDQAAIKPQQQVAFSKAFGPLDVRASKAELLSEHPEIFVVGNTGKKPVTFAPAENTGTLEWHTDHIHLSTPARASLLLARAVPPKGGDTLFACMFSAYDALPAEKQALCDRLEVVNDVAGLLTYLEDQGQDTSERKQYVSLPVIWPLVRAHPRTGRKALYFGNQVSVGIVGWPEDEAKSFIAELTEHACRPDFQYCHKWQVGDAVLWDNRRVLHAGTPYDLNGPPREMHRTTIVETCLPRLV